jgi:hypothetical protein
LPSQHLGSHRQPASLVVVKSQSTVADLSAQNSVFFAQIFGHLLLLVLSPASINLDGHPRLPSITPGT